MTCYFLYVCVCLHMCNTHRDQKRVSDRFPETEVYELRAGAENQAGDLISEPSLQASCHLVYEVCLLHFLAPKSWVDKACFPSRCYHGSSVPHGVPGRRDAQSRSM